MLFVVDITHLQGHVGDYFIGANHVDEKKIYKKKCILKFVLHSYLLF